MSRPTSRAAIRSMSGRCMPCSPRRSAPGRTACRRSTPQLTCTASSIRSSRRRIRAGSCLSPEALRLCCKFSFEAMCTMLALHDYQCNMRESDDGDESHRGTAVLGRRQVPFLHGNQIEVHQRQFLDQELERCEQCERRAQLYITLAGVAGSDPLLLLFTFYIEIAEQGMVAIGAEGTPEAVNLPGIAAQAAAEIAQLLQAALLG